jgi:hypothetical protein
MSRPTREDLRPGVKRFNRWQFVEAHNAWKELAEQCEGADREFLLAMAKIANGFAKIWHKGGEPHAMVQLLTDGLAEVRPFAPRRLELELEDFLKAIEGCLMEAKRWRRGDTEIFHRDLIPRIEFTPRNR